MDHLPEGSAASGPPPTPPPTKRAPGLSALAVGNFILGGLGVVFWLCMGLFVIIVVTPAGEFVPADGLLVPAWWYMLLCFLGSVHSGLAILVGVGYRRRRKVLGWVLGNVYGVLAVGHSLLWIKTFWGSSALWPALVGLVYGLGTLVLLNALFKRHLAS